MDQIKEQPRNKALGLLADAVNAADSFASKPFGYNNPPVRGLFDILGIPSIGNTLNHLSYGDKLSTGSGMTTKIRPDVMESAMVAAPIMKILGRSALSAGRLGEKYAERVVPKIMENGGLGADLLKSLSRGTQSNAVYLPSGALSSNIDDANTLAEKIRASGLFPKVEVAGGGSVYVTATKPNYLKSGAISKRTPEIPVMLGEKPYKARFADHPNYWDSSISSDPFTGNTADDAFTLLSTGKPANNTFVSARFVPGNMVGYINETKEVMRPNRSGKSTVPKKEVNSRPFSFLGDDLINK